MEKCSAVSEYELWIKSKEGKDCLDYTTLNLSSNQMQYFYNRIWHAFHAGVDAGKKISKKEMKEYLEN